MRKIVFLLFILAFIAKPALAVHTKGGWMYYEYLGPGLNDPTKLRYKVGLNLYMVCNPSSAQIDDPINFSVFSGGSPSSFLQDVSVSINTNANTQNCTIQSCYPCMNLIPSICYKVINYETIVELAPRADGYIFTKQRCCRITGLSNITAPSDAVGATYTIKIPGTTAAIPNAHQNSSPKFIFNDTAIVCANSQFTLNFKALDPNGDSLVYMFCSAYTGGSATDPNPNSANAPPYNPVPYMFPYSGSLPLGNQVSINPSTGLISGIAPPAGEYVLSVCVAEYRNGIHFADSRKELHLKIADCFNVTTTLGPDFTTCGDFTLSFQNLLDNPTITSWFWTFGDPSTGSLDTSLLQHPSHTFSAAGDYTIKLVVNKDQPCKDSTTQLVHVYPGFFPGFRPNAPYCVGQPINFTDTTRTLHGSVTGWQWNFGDPSTLADTSRLQNPTYTYTAPGTYQVQFIVANTKGCRDTIFTSVTINANPIVSAFPKDTTYCALDTIGLRANGTGTFSWFGGPNIINPTSATPSVYPTINTKYFVRLTDANGCKALDSAIVRPLNDLTNAITAVPPNICQEDTLTLTGSSNHSAGVTWQWSPAATLSSPATAVTRAFPMSTTTYTLITTWGRNCRATKSIPVNVTPLAVPDAGNPQSICAGQTSAQLQASGGVRYTWSPSTGLSNPNISNPVATPTSTTSYVVSVGVTGCARTKNDTVIVTVHQKPVISATNDTLICNIDTLQIQVNGTGSVLWSPNYMISNVNANNPLVSPDQPTLYHVKLTDSFGCFAWDSVFVDVKQVVTIDAGPDTSICKGDGFTIRTVSDALSYSWSPATAMNDSTLKNPFVRPLADTRYTVVGNIGKCQSVSDIFVRVGPVPLANAGPDDTLCFGRNTQLLATGGSSYSWTPISFLSDPNIANPRVISPARTMIYTVRVSDTLGCIRQVLDSVKVLVIPQLHVDAGPSDTVAVEGQPILLHATGAATYTWSPVTWLTNPTIANPVSTPQDSITYWVVGRDRFGCFAQDSIHISFFTMESDMYVPTAFTPNNDGLNDLARPIMLGMRSLTYFRIYNRFGELVYSTTEIGKGWDGVYKGKGQDAGTFVWYAEGVTFKGQVKKKKGYVVLIR